MYSDLKRKERRAARAVARGTAAAFSVTKSVLGTAASWTAGRFTVIVVPPDQRTPHSLTFSTGRCLLSGILIAAISLCVPSLRSQAASVESRSDFASAATASSTALSDSLRDEIAVLASKSAPLVAELQRIDSALTLGVVPAVIEGEKKDDRGMSAFFPLGRREVDELGKLVALRSSLEESADLLRETERTLRNLQATSGELPLLWPLKGGIGHVSMYFGYNPNPFTGIPYLHMGLDLGTYGTGDPVVASADGVVLAAYYDIYSGYGNNVIIRHEHGYYTRYAHLQSFSVVAGKKISQGEVVGRLGGTGRVDAPHLHYEIRLGPEILDPLPFIVFKTAPAKLPATPKPAS